MFSVRSRSHSYFAFGSFNRTILLRSRNRIEVTTSPAIKIIVDEIRGFRGSTSTSTLPPTFSILLISESMMRSARFTCFSDTWISSVGLRSIGRRDSQDSFSFAKTVALFDFHSITRLCGVRRTSGTIIGPRLLALAHDARHTPTRLCSLCANSIRWVNRADRIAEYNRQCRLNVVAVTRASRSEENS